MWCSAIGCIVTLTLTTLLAPLLADAQPPARVPRVGLLWLGPMTDRKRLQDYEAFRQGLRELGYVEGQNLALELRSAEGQPERLPALAAELVHLKVDLIMAVPTIAVQAAKQASNTIPIVMGPIDDPVASGFVASLARPSGNITGLSLMSPEVSAKRLELLQEAVLGLSRVAVLWNSAHLSKVLEWRETQAAAEKLGVTLRSVEVQRRDDFDAAFAAMTEWSPNALIVVGDPLTITHRARIVEFAAKSRLPAMYSFRQFADEGGLMAYGPSFPALFRRVAAFVDKILKGVKPADLPVEQPTTFELVVNLKTAEALGLTLPPSVLFQANEVIK
jgi:ABC-type uncharacterized transport system substrate-binding protein